MTTRWYPAFEQSNDQQRRPATVFAIQARFRRIAPKVPITAALFLDNPEIRHRIAATIVQSLIVYLMSEIGRISSIRDLSPFRRVLIVDDHFDSADMAAELLQELGHETRVAYSPVSAISIVASFHPQVALLDIGLPNMSGYELAALLRAHPALAGCRFVALTGGAYDSDRRLSEAAGFAGHLTKPFGAQALFDAVAGDSAIIAPAAGRSG